MPLSLLSTYATYVRGLAYFLRTGGDFSGCPFLQSDAELPIKVRSSVVYYDWIDWIMMLCFNHPIDPSTDGRMCLPPRPQQ